MDALPRAVLADVISHQVRVINDESLFYTIHPYIRIGTYWWYQVIFGFQ